MALPSPNTADERVDSFTEVCLDIINLADEGKKMLDLLFLFMFVEGVNNGEMHSKFSFISILGLENNIGEVSFL